MEFTGALKQKTNKNSKSTTQAVLLYSHTKANYKLFLISRHLFTTIHYQIIPQFKGFTIAIIEICGQRQVSMQQILKNQVEVICCESG